MCSRGKAYIIKAGTIILVCNTVVQIMQTFNWKFQYVEETDAADWTLAPSETTEVTEETVGRCMGTTKDECADLYFPNETHEKALELLEESLENASRILSIKGGEVYEGLEETCEKMGLEYLYYSTPSYYFIQGQMFKTEEICKNDAKHQTLLFNYTKEDADAAINRSVERWHKYLDKEINDFIKFIQTMQKGNLYIGCEFGTYTTENALMLNAHFNPLFLRGQKFISIYNRVLTPKLINLYKNLTTEHKRLLGWTKEYDQLVLKRLQSYVH